jgi:hypothetical protein
MANWAASTAIVAGPAELARAGVVLARGRPRAKLLLLGNAAAVTHHILETFFAKLEKQLKAHGTASTKIALALEDNGGVRAYYNSFKDAVRLLRHGWACFEKTDGEVGAFG